MIDPQLADIVDAMAQVAFDRGESHFVDALARWDAANGALGRDDPEFDAWASARADWALCEGWPRDDDGRSRWLAIARAAEVDLVRAARLARSVVGLFEVWPASTPWLRDRIGGLCLRAATALDLVAVGDGPAALWELRVVIEGGTARAVRPPIDHPRELADLWPDPIVPDLDGPARLVPALHRGRRRWSRTPRHGVRACFAELLAMLATAAPRSSRPA